ncbi:MAG: hypothetical protein DRP02_13950 [Candidatus Gerdarchaeota archaeon]|nr:MAG: hypothetical protein B5M51_05370 [Anaerolinea sp. 4484_236]RLI67747.1 MAG: hypothetical protein DRP02_13950 [Candidatus Gerdarchaeota archaeon]
MKEETDKITDDLLPEYDLDDFFKTATRGKYAQRYKEGTNLVLLEPDVAKFFSDDKKVNEILRLVIKMTNMQDKAPETA